MAGQANAHEIVEATLEDCDGAPPLYAIMVHAILPWVPDQGLALRLPSTVGFGVMILPAGVLPAQTARTLRLPSGADRVLFQPGLLH